MLHKARSPGAAIVSLGVAPLAAILVFDRLSGRKGECKWRLSLSLAMGHGRTDGAGRGAATILVLASSVFFFIALVFPRHGEPRDPPQLDGDLKLDDDLCHVARALIAASLAASDPRGRPPRLRQSCSCYSSSSVTTFGFASSRS